MLAKPNVCWANYFPSIDFFILRWDNTKLLSPRPNENTYASVMVETTRENLILNWMDINPLSKHFRKEYVRRNSRSNFNKKLIITRDTNLQKRLKVTNPNKKRTYVGEVEVEH